MEAVRFGKSTQSTLLKERTLDRQRSVWCLGTLALLWMTPLVVNAQAITAVPQVPAAVTATPSGLDIIEPDAEVVVVNLTVFGLNRNQSAVNTLMQQVCAQSADETGAVFSDLASTCALLDTLEEEDPELGRVLDEIAPEEAFAINDTLIYLSDYQTTNIFARINALRQGPGPTTDAPAIEDTTSNLGTFRLPQTALAQLPNDATGYGGGAAADGFFSKLDVFAAAYLSNGDVDGVIFQQDADFRTTNITAGADYRFSTEVVAGLAVGFMQTKLDYARVRGSTDTTGLNVTTFGTWYEQDKGYAEIVLDVGLNTHDLDRQVSVGNDPVVTASGGTESVSTTLTIGGGRDFNVSGWDFGPYFRLALSAASVRGYSEKTSGTTAGFANTFQVNSQSVRSTKMTIGGQISKVFNTSRAILIPQVRLEFEAENDKKKDELQITNTQTGLSTTLVATNRDARYTNLGIGGSAVFKNGKSAYVFYETHLTHDFVNQNWLKIGGRLEF